MRRLFLIGGGAFLLAVIAYLLVALYWPNTFPGGAEQSFFVSRGQSFRSIADSLEAQGLISSRSRFSLVARLLGGADRLQIGKYQFTSGISNARLFLSLRSGRDNSMIKVTIPEGYRARTQARVFSRTIGTDSARFMSLVHDPLFIDDLGLRDTVLEGYLMPDTYGFTWQQDEAEIIEQMVAKFKEFYSDSLQARQEEMQWTVREVLTLASIVEAEAVRDNERPIIAGVYLNRLRRGMKLEADPTVQYGLEEEPRRVLYADLKVDHPYNTYLRRGLPPGPINNPGRASILAVLYPAKHSYLFFVADGQGGHRFASSYTEHRKNVRLYRRARRAATSKR